MPAFNMHNRISDAAALVAYYRAMETERPDGILKDPLARHLTRDLGLNNDSIMQHEHSSAWPIVIRSHIFDELILQILGHERVDTVLNLGAGFDTRPYRLSLPRTLRWVEVDRPEVLSYKEQRLKAEKPSCCLEHVKLDLCDVSMIQELLHRINGDAARVLIVSEGVLLYFTEAEVAALADNLHVHHNCRWWLVDHVSPVTLSFLKYSLHEHLREYKTLKFAPDDAQKFFQKHGWKVCKRRSLWDEAKRFKREMTWLQRIRSVGLPAMTKFTAKFRWNDACLLLQRSERLAVKTKTALQHLS